MRRPTIADLAREAGVSVSTVNRVIAKAGTVRPAMRERVLDAARRIAFYGLGTIEHSVRASARRRRLGVLLQREGHAFYRGLGQALHRAARSDGAVDLDLAYLDDLSPDTVAMRLGELVTRCEAVALVAAEHPVVSEAIDAALARGVAVVALIAPLSARGNVGFVGLDAWKVGRTAAWAVAHAARSGAKIGILLGNPRYRNHELNESGFRSYFREHGTDVTLLEPRLTYESAAVAREMTEELLAEHPNLGGLFVSGGGITGAIAALREAPRPPRFIAVGYELFAETRAALRRGGSGTCSGSATSG